MNPPTVPPSAQARVARSLVSWWEIPPRSSLVRGDSVRFAHSIATLTRQLLTAVNSLNDAPPSWDGPWLLAPAHFGDRLVRMASLEDREEAAGVAESLLDDVLDLLSGRGVAEADLRFEQLRTKPIPSLSLERAMSLALAAFERARALTARAVLIADSFARGCADEGSDLDIRLLVESVPSLAERRTLVEPFAEMRLIRQYGDEAYITADQFLWNGRKVDVKYHPIARIERALAERFALGAPIDLLELLEVHVSVADPDGLAARLVGLVRERQHRAREVAAVSLEALHHSQYTTSSHRSPVEAVVTVLGPGLEYIVRAWAGLNGRIHAFPKWMHWIASDLGAGPPNAWDRLLTLVTEPWTRTTLEQRMNEWHSLVEDFVALGRARGFFSGR